MKAELVQFGVFKVPKEKLPAAIGVFELKGRGADNHPVTGISFKVHFDIDTLDREGFLLDLRNQVAADMKIIPADVVFDEEKVLIEMRMFKWSR
jgi:hypothetical protein